MCDLLTIFKNKFRKIENLTKKCVNLEGAIYIYIPNEGNEFQITNKIKRSLNDLNRMELQ